MVILKYWKKKGIKTKDLCSACMDKRVLGSEKCLYHIVYQICANHKISYSLIDSLIDKLYYQKFECYYTGKLLIPGDNLSLDHVIPKSTNLNNELNNLVWVDWSINKIKSSKSFLDFIRDKEDLLLEKNYVASLVKHEDKVKILKHLLNDSFSSNIIIS